MFILLNKYNILNSIDLYIITIFGYCFEIFNFIITQHCNVTRYCIVCIIILYYMVLTVSSIK